MTKIKLIMVDGPDGAGKTTFIRSLLQKHKAKLFTMPKSAPDGSLMKINTAKHFEIMKAFLVLLDPNYTYIFDRCYLSNLVYDENQSESMIFREWLLEKSEINLLEIILLRNHVVEDFEDDKISLSRDQFNRIIDRYELFSNYLTPPKIFNTIIWGYDDFTDMPCVTSVSQMQFDLAHLEVENFIDV
ncbi:MAG: hypothetical protein QM489_00655 [Candidatus Izemoplasma sp.]